MQRVIDADDAVAQGAQGAHDPLLAAAHQGEVSERKADSTPKLSN